MDLNLKGKVVLVTGGSRGLGTALCEGFAAEGCDVVVNYTRNAEKAQVVADRIQERFGVRAVALGGDVSKESDVQHLFAEAWGHLGPVDILVNNAGICPTGFIKDIPTEEWTRTIEINLIGTFLSCREMVRRLIDADRPGKIVNIVSQAAFNGSATGKSHYAASKAGVVAFSVSLAYEVAQNNITVNCVAPGMMLTEMTQETLAQNADKYKQKIPLGRVADLEEVANVVAFIASEKSSYMTGATVDVSGGMLMR